MDARYRGNKLRFANHSATPNCSAKILQARARARGWGAPPAVAGSPAGGAAAGWARRPRGVASSRLRAADTSLARSPARPPHATPRQVDGDHRVGIYAAAPIGAHDELFYDYMYDPKLGIKWAGGRERRGG